MSKVPEIEVDEIGIWSEVKLEIIRKYAKSYSEILSRQSYMNHCYIDAFAGLGYHKSKATQELVKGSPQLAVETDPPFKKYYFVDIDATRVSSLNKLKVHKPHQVEVYEGDSNPILTEKILPLMRREDYKRALCLLDPYGLQLDWSVMQMAGKMGTVEIFINFPIMDMNRNALLRNTDKVDPKQAQRMTKFWGDESWKNVAYNKSGNLFGWDEKESNDTIVKAFCKRLKDVAGFGYVAKPLPMRNATNAVVYYLLFASPNKTGDKIVGQILDKYR